MRRWIWVFGKRNIVNGGQTIAFADNWDRWVPSIIASGFAAPLLGRSENIDVEHNASTAPVWGVVRRYKVLSREDATKKGFLQRDDLALYAEVEQWGGGTFAYTSPAIYFDFKDDNGQIWPASIQHIAVVGQPAQQTGQPVQHDLERVALRRSEMAEVNEGVLDGAAESTDEVVDAASELEEALRNALEQNNILQARIAELEAQIADLLSEKPEDDADEELRKDLRRLKARVDILSADAIASSVAELRAALGVDASSAKRLAETLSRSEIARIVNLRNATPAKQDRVSTGYPVGKSTKRKAKTKAELVALARAMDGDFSANLRKLIVEEKKNATV